MNKIKKNKLGYKYIYPKPNKEKLEAYYKKKYFKKHIAYKNKLNDVERNNLKCISVASIFMLNLKLKNLKNKNLLDLGAGQGTFLKNISHLFNKCLGVDFSEKNFFDTKRSNIDFVSMNPGEFITKKNLKNYDVINCKNVLEHVIDPIDFMRKINKNIKNNAYLILTVPNDFSNLQKETNKIVKKKKYWIAPPEHLNYFNKQTFLNFSKKMGFKVLDGISDFPIELFLLKEEFDYTKNPKIGKIIYLLKCEFMSYLQKKAPIEDIYELLKIFYKLNIGRDNIFLLKKNN